MNILEQEDIIKGLPDQALMQEAQMPSGQVPQYLVVSEIQRRSDMRKRYKSEQEQMPQGTVKEQVMQEGIMGAVPQMPPQMAMAPQMPQRMPQMPPPQMPPQGIQQAMPPQMMSGGGVIRMDEGRQAQGGLNLDPLRKRLGALGDTVKDIESSNRQTDSSGNVLRSIKGAVGLMQVMPATAAQPGYGVPSIFDLARRAGIEVNEDQVTFDREVLEDGKIKITPTAEAIAEADRLLENPSLNEAIGLQYLEAMVDEFDGDLDRIGIAYNAGPKVAERWDGDPESLKKETRDYIGKLKSSDDVVNARDSFMGLEPQATPAEGSPEAQAQVVEAIERRRAASPPPSAEQQLLDMAGDRPMPVVGQRAPRESVSVTAPRPPVASFDNTFDPTIAAPNISIPNLPPALPPEPQLSFVTPQGVRVNETLTPPPADARTQLLEMAGDRPLPVLEGQPQIENVDVTAPLFPPVAPFNNAYSPSAIVPNVLLPETPLPTDGREPIASRLAKRTLDRYTDYDPVAPVFSEEGIFRAQGGVDSGVATLPTSQEIADARAAYMGRTGMPPAGDARVQATGSAEVQAGASGSFPLSGSTLEGIAGSLYDYRPPVDTRGRPKEGFPSREEMARDLLGSDTAESLFDYRPPTDQRGRRPEGTLSARDYFIQQAVETSPEALGQYLPNANLGVDLGIGPTGPVTNPFGMPSASGDTSRADEAMRFSQGLSANLLANPTQEMLSRLDAPNLTPLELDKDLGLPKGEVDPETTLIDAVASQPGNDKSNPANNPKTTPVLDFADLIADSRRQAMSNALIQLGAGIAGGDVSKGIAAAGQAATAGTQDARDLDMRRRLAEYEAGREDLRREEEARRYDEGMKLKREQFQNDVSYRAAKLTADIEAADDISRRSLLTGVNSLLEEASDELLRLDQSGASEQEILELQTYINTLRQKSRDYMNEIAAGIGRGSSYEGYELVGQR